MADLPMVDLRETAGSCAIERDIVVVSGLDARRYLQGQLSQDLSELGPGESTWSFVLEPTGKVDAWVRVTNRSTVAAGTTREPQVESFALDVDGGHGAALQSRLQRFLLRTKAVTELLVGGTDIFCRAFRGPGSGSLEVSGDLLWDAAAGWPGIEGHDSFTAVATQHPSTVAPEALELLRIECGVPSIGTELVPGETIPAEAGTWLIDTSVSFTKGCYTGQELVARIDSRGNNVPRRLRRVVAAVPGPHALPPAGADVVIDGKVVGTLTSVAWSPWHDRAVALAYVGRNTDVPAQATVVSASEPSQARIEAIAAVDP